MSDLKTRACGAIHSEGIVCMRTVYYEPGCCADSVWPHEGPHQHTGLDGVISHRWIEKRVIEDLAFDGYMPLEEDQPAKEARAA